MANRQGGQRLARSASLRSQFTLWLGCTFTPSLIRCYNKKTNQDSHSHITSRRSSHPTHQQGNNARPPGHNVLWTTAHHCSAELTTAAALDPTSQAADLTPLHLRAVQLLTATIITGETQYFTDLTMAVELQILR
jgi:hypothetical protein